MLRLAAKFLVRVFISAVKGDFHGGKIEIACAPRVKNLKYGRKTAQIENSAVKSHFPIQTSIPIKNLSYAFICVHTFVYTYL